MLIPGLGHRPDCFVFPCGRLASRHSKRVAQRVSLRVVTTHRLPANQTSHRLDATRELLFKLSMFKLSWRLESCLARTASLEAGPLGTSLMLLMKRATAQGGNALSFPHLGITKVGRDFPHPFRCPEARFTPVFRAPIFSRK